MNQLKHFANNHPQLTSWIVLAIGMVVILIWSAWEVGFTPQQWAAVIITTILLAGACVWIIGWGDDADDAEAYEEAEAGE